MEPLSNVGALAAAERLIRRAATLAEMEKEPKRRRGDPPDSCGKSGDPHDLDEGALASNGHTLSQKRRRRLDARYVGGGGLSTRELGRAP